MTSDSPAPAPQDNGPNFQAASGDNGDVAVKYRCDTSNSSCSGLARFSNGPGNTYSYTVWFQNGNAGRSNFVLGPNQSHSIHVQGGDTFSMAAGNVVVPVDAPRGWIGVD